MKKPYLTQWDRRVISRNMNGRDFVQLKFTWAKIRRSMFGSRIKKNAEFKAIREEVKKDLDHSIRFPYVKGCIYENNKEAKEALNKAFKTIRKEAKLSKEEKRKVKDEFKYHDHDERRLNLICGITYNDIEKEVKLIKLKTKMEKPALNKRRIIMSISAKYYDTFKSKIDLIKEIERKTGINFIDYEINKTNDSYSIVGDIEKVVKPKTKNMKINLFITPKQVSKLIDDELDAYSDVDRWDKLELELVLDDTPKTKPKLEDKMLVWAWVYTEKKDTVQVAGFYDSKNKTLFHADGNRNGDSYDTYKPFKGDWPKWAKKAYKKLED